MEATFRLPSSAWRWLALNSRPSSLLHAVSSKLSPYSAWLRDRMQRQLDQSRGLRASKQRQVKEGWLMWREWHSSRLLPLKQLSRRARLRPFELQQAVVVQLAPYVMTCFFRSFHVDGKLMPPTPRGTQGLPSCVFVRGRLVVA